MQNEQNQEGATSKNTEETVEETTTGTTEQDTVDWKAEALKQKAINERLSKKLSNNITKPEHGENQAPREYPKPSDILRSDEMALYREGYTNDEIDLIMRNGGRALLKDEKNPISLGLKVAKEQRQAEEAASRAQDTSGTSELERKYTRDDLEKMKPEEIEKILGVADRR